MQEGERRSLRIDRLVSWRRYRRTWSSDLSWLDTAQVHREVVYDSFAVVWNEEGAEETRTNELN